MRIAVYIISFLYSVISLAFPPIISAHKYHTMIQDREGNSVLLGSGCTNQNLQDLIYLSDCFSCNRSYAICIGMDKNKHLYTIYENKKETRLLNFERIDLCQIEIFCKYCFMLDKKGTVYRIEVEDTNIKTNIEPVDNIVQISIFDAPLLGYLLCVLDRTGNVYIYKDQKYENIIGPETSIGIVKQIAVSKNILMVLTCDGLVYYTPIFETDQLNKNELNKIDKLNNIIKIVSGDNHFLFLGEEGKIYSVGNGSFGVLGHGDEESLAIPKKIAALSHVKIIDVFACNERSYAVDENDELYSFGRGYFGALDRPDFPWHDRLFPTKIKDLKTKYNGIWSREVHLRKPIKFRTMVKTLILIHKAQKKKNMLIGFLPKVILFEIIKWIDINMD